MRLWTAALGFQALMVCLSVGCKSGNQERNAKLDPATADERRYSVGLYEARTAVEAALGELDLRIEAEQLDALGGRIVALRANDQRIFIDLLSVAEHTTSVSIGGAAIDRNMSALIHSHIQRTAKSDPGAAELFGGNSIDVTYDCALPKAVLAAERACEILNLEISRRTVDEQRADILAYWPKSKQALIRIESVKEGADGAENRPPQGKPQPQPQPQPRPAAPGAQPEKPQVHVTFVVGTTRGEENEKFARRLQTEFERSLR